MSSRHASDSHSTSPSRMVRTMTTRILCALVVAASLLGVPAAAQAASVSLVGSTLRYTAGAGEANRVTVTPSGGNFRVDDTGLAAIADGDGAGGCSVAGNRATCP